MLKMRDEPRRSGAEILGLSAAAFERAGASETSRAHKIISNILWIEKVFVKRPGAPISMTKFFSKRTHDSEESILA